MGFTDLYRRLRMALDIRRAATVPAPEPALARIAATRSHRPSDPQLGEPSTDAALASADFRGELLRRLN